MQHERNNERVIGRLLSRSPHQVWAAVEDEAGPLDKISDADLRRAVQTELRIAAFTGQSLTVPDIIAERITSSVIAKCHASTDKAAVAEAKRLLRLLRVRIRAKHPRPKHRPRKNWYQRQAERLAVHELELRRRELMYEGLSGNEAIEQAAEEIALGLPVTAATVRSWWSNPGRRRRRK